MGQEPLDSFERGEIALGGIFFFGAISFWMFFGGVPVASWALAGLVGAIALWWQWSLLKHNGMAIVIGLLMASQPWLFSHGLAMFKDAVAEFGNRDILLAGMHLGQATLMIAVAVALWNVGYRYVPRWWGLAIALWSAMVAIHYQNTNEDLYWTGAICTVVWSMQLGLRPSWRLRR